MSGGEQKIDIVLACVCPIVYFSVCECNILLTYARARQRRQSEECYCARKEEEGERLRANSCNTKCTKDCPTGAVVCVAASKEEKTTEDNQKASLSPNRVYRKSKGELKRECSENCVACHVKMVLIPSREITSVGVFFPLLNDSQK